MSQGESLNTVSINGEFFSKLLRACISGENLIQCEFPKDGFTGHCLLSIDGIIELAGGEDTLQQGPHLGDPAGARPE